MEILLDRLLQAIEVFTTYFNDSTSLFVVAVGVSIGLLVLSAIYLISTLSDSKRRRIRKEVYSGDRATQANAVGRRIESGVALSSFWFSRPLTKKGWKPRSDCMLGVTMNEVH